MRNDQERREFIDNQDNWQPVGSDATGNVRIMSLKYLGNEWQRVDVYREYERFDYEKLGYVKEIGWVPTDTFSVNSEGIIGNTITKTQILNRIKEIDKEERAKK
ncbi:MAG: hypothetical protein IKE28_12040 [Solobacterium sp.]|nr:hypothetical protein [Solobacterium sp.]